MQVLLTEEKNLYMAGWVTCIVDGKTREAFLLKHFAAHFLQPNLLEIIKL